jgi:outer membrane receptor protein involved in Fe transport
MHTPFRLLFVFCAWLVVVPRAVESQSLAVNTPTQNRLARSLSDARVTYAAVNVTLDEALRAIARQAGLGLTVDRSVVQLDQRVTLDVRNVSLTAALAAATARTSVVTHLSPDGETIIVAKISVRGGAQVQGVVTGKVTSGKTKQPVVGATIALDGASAGVVTNEGGVFRLPASVGEHMLHVRGLGFVKQSKRVVVVAEQTVVMDIVLEPSASVLDEVIVTGTVVATERKAIPTPITVITADDIEKRGITRVEQLLRGEIPGVIALEKGVSSYNAGPYAALGGMETSTVYARGSSNVGTSATPTPLKTYVDGVELLDPSYLGTIDPKSIERIEIITGPQAATVYGSGAMGGVMQIFTKKGSGATTPKVTLSLGYGMLESNIASNFAPTHNHTLNVVGGSGPEFSYSGNASYRYSGQWQPNLFTRSMGASIGATHTRGRVTFDGSVSTTSGRNGTSIDGNPRMFVKFHEAGLWDISGYDFGSASQATSSSQTSSLNVDIRLMPQWQHHFTAGRSQTTFSLLPPKAEYYNPADTLLYFSSVTGQRVTLGYNTTVVSRVGGWLSSSLTIGANGSSAEQIQNGGCTATRDATSLIACSTSLPIAVRRPRNERSWGGFGTWQLGFLERLYVTLGLRGERNPAYGSAHRTDWTPTNGVTYTQEIGQLTVKLLGSYGRATRAPDPTRRSEIVSNLNNSNPAQYLSQLGNPDLTPEYSRGPQGGVELYYGNLGSLTVNRYQQTVTDLMQQVVVDSILRTLLTTGAQSYLKQNQWVNAAKVRQSGWEGTGSVNVGPLTVKGTYSWNDSRVLAVSPLYTGNLTRGRSFTGLMTHSGYASATYAYGGTSIVGSMSYVGATLVDSRPVMVFYDALYSRTKMYVDRFGVRTFFSSKPGYAKSDLAISQRVNAWASATLNVNNLANSFQSDAYEYYPSLGRQTTVGMTLRFPR